MELQRISSNTSLADVPFHGKTGVLGTYIVEGDKRAVIDPGPPVQAKILLEWMKEQNKVIDIVALTHIHLDHAAGTWNIVEEYPDVVVHVHPRGSQHLIDPTALLEAADKQFRGETPDYGEVRGVPAENIRESVDCEVLDLGGAQLQTLWTPGHSTHSQTYLEPSYHTIFTGDAAGQINNDTILPASPPPFNPVQTNESIDKIIQLSPETLCVSHFGYRENAVEYLAVFKERVKLWSRLSTLAVEKGVGLRELFDMVMEKDHAIEKMTSMDPDARHSVYSSLTGFLGYAKWMKEKQAN